jgi:hypothetical protein
MVAVPRSPSKNTQHCKCDALQPNSGWMFTRNKMGHTQQRKTTRNTEKLQSLKVVLSTSMKMRQEPNSKFCKPTSDLRTQKSSRLLLMETHRINRTQKRTNGTLKNTKNTTAEKGHQSMSRLSWLSRLSRFLRRVSRAKLNQIGTKFCIGVHKSV